MGKASSNKKVARAAGTGGGRTRGGRRPWNFYGVVAIIVILGVVGTWASRDRRISQINGAGTVPPTVGTTWYEGYGVYVCGKFLPAITSTKDPYGITTSGKGNQKGVIVIHPTVKSAAGDNATLGKFASAVGMTLNAAELQVPGGKLYTNGDNCNGTPGHVYVREFAYTGDKIGVLANKDPRQVKLQDQAMLTVAFVPATDKNKIPPPPSYVESNLTSLAASANPSASSSSTTTPPAVSTPTTAPGSKTTTAPSTTTPTTAASTTTPTTAASTTAPSTTATTAKP